MPKIMLVEDDNNLREIYGARLSAEGHTIVAARDGEEALALAVKEKPDLIISDVMMPRISGFDMLDILRNAPETKNTKVIMMTALSQAEDKARADELGADLYLVKSQVTLEDVAKAVDQVLKADEAVADGNNQSNSTAQQSGQSPITQPTVQTTQNPAATVTPSPPPVANQPVQPTVTENSQPSITPTSTQPSQSSVPPPATPAEPTQPEPPNAPVDNAPLAPTEQVAPPPETVSAVISTSDQPASSGSINQSTNLDASPSSAVIPKKIDITEPATQVNAATPSSEQVLTAPTVNSIPTNQGNPNEENLKAPAPLEVVLPSPPSEVGTSSTSEADASTTKVAVKEPLDTSADTTTVGPSLKQALENEEKDVRNRIPGSEEKNPNSLIATNDTNSGEAPSSEFLSTDEKSSDDTAKNDSTNMDSETESIQNDNLNKRVVQPINDPTKGPDLNELLAKEEAKEADQTNVPSTGEDSPSESQANTETAQPDNNDSNDPPESSSSNDEFSKIAL